MLGLLACLLATHHLNTQTCTHISLSLSLSAKGRVFVNFEFPLFTSDIHKLVRLEQYCEKRWYIFIAFRPLLWSWCAKANIIIYSSTGSKNGSNRGREGGWKWHQSKAIISFSFSFSHFLVFLLEIFSRNRRRRTHFLGYVSDRRVC